MRRLGDENLKKCISLLREFIEGAPQDRQKGRATLALNQLQRITAGTTENSDFTCIEIPLADGTPMGQKLSFLCIDTPLADGSSAL